MTKRQPAIVTPWLTAALASGIKVVLSARSPLPDGARALDHAEPPTPHELASRALFAARCNCSPERWDIVVSLPPGGACDYADASPGVPGHLAYGQAIKRKDGTWAQEPRSKRAVLLAWKGASK